MDSRSVDYSSHLTVECDDELGFFLLLLGCDSIALDITCQLPLFGSDNYCAGIINRE